MAQCVCYSCGAMKFGPFSACIACSRRPEADEDLLISLALSADYFDLRRLGALSAQVRSGTLPKLGPESRKRLMRAVRQIKASSTPVPEISPAA